LSSGKGNVENDTNKYFYTQSVDFRVNKNALWIHVIRAFAIVCIVFQHNIPMNSLSRYNSISLFNWWVSDIYRVIFKVGVPLFFMLTGCTLLNKNDSIPVFFRKRISKVLLPFIVWSAFYTFWKVYYFGEVLTISRVFLFIREPVYFHMWFLYVLLGLYLYIPILRIIVLHAGNKILYYFVALWYVNTCITPILRDVLHKDVYPTLGMFGGYVGYLVLGYLLSSIKVTKKGISLLLYFILACICFSAFGNFLQACVEHCEISYYFHRDLNIVNVVLSVAVFLCLKYFSENTKLCKNKIIIKAVERVSAASFGIYLIHPVFISIGCRSGVLYYTNSFFHNALSLVPLRTMLVFFISFISIYVLQKIPIIKRCVP